MGCGSSRVASIGSWTTKEKSLVRSSWKKFVEGNIIEDGAHLYFRLFDKYPDAQKLFSFAKDQEVIPANMLKNAQFRNHVKKVFETVGVAVADMDKLEELISILKELGARHYTYGVTMPQYKAVGECLLYAIENKLGSEYDKETDAAWKRFFQTIEIAMQSGMEDEKRKAQASG